MKNPIKILTLTGLTLGAVLGMAGTLVPSPNLRSLLWAIDGVGLIVATSLLAVRFLRTGQELLAAGFLVYALGESVILSGNAPTLAAGAPSFAGGTALWSAALLLLSLSSEFASWLRVAGVLGSILFAATSLQIFNGAQLTPLSSPLPFFAYPVLVLNIVGWIITLVREKPVK
jgi:hypothetical protein